MNLSQNHISLILRYKNKVFLNDWKLLHVPQNVIGPNAFGFPRNSTLKLSFHFYQQKMLECKNLIKCEIGIVQLIEHLSCNFKVKGSTLRSNMILPIFVRDLSSFPPRRRSVGCWILRRDAVESSWMYRLSKLR